MEWHMNPNRIRIATIKEVREESAKIRTLYFEDDLCLNAQPGQFVMVWIPRIDEIPLSISLQKNGLSSVTVKKVGEATNILCSMEKGDSIGIRGPFGKGFEHIGSKALIVGGGIGAAPLMFLAEKLVKLGVKTAFIQGAKTKSEIIFNKELEEMSKTNLLDVVLATEDGSLGVRGTAADLAEIALSKERYDVIYVCGKELMIKKIFLLAKEKGIQIQASLERLMRCAVGICGSCVIGKYRVCRDGPVFDLKMLKEIRDELGKFKRGFDGRREKI
ncbi:MAG: dihydroorotate dehydrogenase electron transfer subunit [Candidatus Bathyarchaeota archaeon]|nr:dihydroorotate dehydrogenase electron transfer subunit [Candidatus Bathyarchaeota archaeon]